MGTKHVDATTLNRIIGKLGYVKIEGRSTLALRASLNVLELATRSKLREKIAGTPTRLETRCENVRSRRAFLRPPVEG